MLAHRRILNKTHSCTRPRRPYSSRITTKNQEPKRTVGRYKLFPLVSAFSVAILAAGFFGILTSYDKPIKATLYGQDISQSTWQQIEERIAAQVNQLSIPVRIDDQSIVFSPSEAGITSDAPKWAEDIKMSEAYRRKHPWELFSTKDYTPTPTLDKTKLSRTLAEKNLQTIAPIDAQISVDGVDIIVTPAVDGWGADSDVLAQKVAADIIDLKTSPVDLPRTAIKATYSTASAEKAKLELEQKINVVPSITGLFTPDRGTILSWYSIQPDPNGSFLVIQDKATLTQTIDRAITEIDVVKEDRVEFRMLDGGKFVSVDGRVGKKVTNRDAILAAWLGGQSLQAQIQETPFAVVDGGEFNQWILVDLDARQAYAYVGQEIVRQFAVSGGKSITPTPLGTFKIFAKTPVQTMCGNYVPEGYSCTPNVRWSSWFFPDYALHGAWWHNEFGVINRSHGCVNFRDNDAQWVYDWAPIGTPVIVRQTR
jgi:L,D-transpeptidase catalytic domain/Putative peptidoglycan binding domain